MDNDSLDHLARVFGRLYDDSLHASKLCNEADCSSMENGFCDCSYYLRDVIDMIWEAKDRHPERFDALIAMVEAEEQAKDERPGA
jgi:hypothetical protein